MYDFIYYAAQPLGIIVLWFLIGLWVWWNDD
jgi:hypothetical protein